MNALTLFPLLRPMIPSTGHFAVLPSHNALIIIDTSANVRCIKNLIKAVDTGKPYEPEPSGSPTQDHASRAETSPHDGGA